MNRRSFVERCVAALGSCHRTSASYCLPTVHVAQRRANTMHQLSQSVGQAPSREEEGAPAQLAHSVSKNSSVCHAHRNERKCQSADATRATGASGGGGCRVYGRFSEAQSSEFESEGLEFQNRGSSRPPGALRKLQGPGPLSPDRGSERRTACGAPGQGEGEVSKSGLFSVLDFQDTLNN